MIRIQARKSELQAESRSYSQADPRIRTEIHLRQMLKKKDNSWHRVLQGVPPRGRQLDFTFSSPPDPLFSGKKKAHKHNFFVRLVLGRPWVCPWDESGENLLILHTGSPANQGLSQRQTRVCPWDKPGAEGRHRKFM